MDCPSLLGVPLALPLAHEKAEFPTLQWIMVSLCISKYMMPFCQYLHTLFPMTNLTTSRQKKIVKVNVSNRQNWKLKRLAGKVGSQPWKSLNFWSFSSNSFILKVWIILLLYLLLLLLLLFPSEKMTSHLGHRNQTRLITSSWISLQRTQELRKPPSEGPNNWFSVTMFYALYTGFCMTWH